MKTASHSSSGRAGLRLSAFFQRTWLSEPLIFRSPIPGQSCSWCSRKGWVLLAATEQLGQNSGVEPQAGSDAHLVGHGPWWMTGHSGTASAFYASVAVQCVAPQPQSPPEPHTSPLSPEAWSDFQERRLCLPLPFSPTSV